MATLLKWALEHPVAAAALAVAVLAVGYFVLNHKPALVKDAERRVKEMRGKSQDRYNQLRPPR
ncbi:MAG: hypothetical protein HY699_07960 [Deltaproteobacteria bacterium]|nr:hypothetical protein [Deltaproteobacteria bacterium]